MDYEFEIEWLLRLWDSGSRAEVIPRILAHGGIDALILTAHLVDNLAIDDPGSQDEFLTALHDARSQKNGAEEFRLRVLKTEEDYSTARAFWDKSMAAAIKTPHTSETVIDYFEVLSLLMKGYEQRRLEDEQEDEVER